MLSSNPPPQYASSFAYIKPSCSLPISLQFSSHKYLCLIPMEHLAIESFSYSWLINLQKPNSLEDAFGISPTPPHHPYPFDKNIYYYDDQEECFIEMDPKNMATSFEKALEIQDFNFHVSAATLEPLTLVHADQIFANGLLVPLHHRLTMQRRPSLEYFCSSSISEPIYSPVSSSSTISSPSSSSTILSSSSTAFLPRCQRYSRRILLTCVGLLRPLCWWVQRRRRRRRTGRGMNMVSRQRRPTSPSRISTSSSSSVTEWEETHTMISEAVLHCKRSNGEYLGL